MVYSDALRARRDKERRDDRLPGGWTDQGKRDEARKRHGLHTRRGVEHERHVHREEETRKEGGPIVWARRIIVERRGWLTDPEFADILSLCQFLPGPASSQVGIALGISPRTAKAHCDALRQKLGVPRRRQIPVAFRLLTGEDPLASRLASARADNGG